MEGVPCRTLLTTCSAKGFPVDHGEMGISSERRTMVHDPSSLSGMLAVIFAEVNAPFRTPSLARKGLISKEEEDTSSTSEMRLYFSCTGFQFSTYDRTIALASLLVFGAASDVRQFETN